MVDEIELKPCPFCGEIPEIESYGIAGHGKDNVVRCENILCSNHTAGFMHIETWNNRPIEDALRAEIEKLKFNYAEAMSQYDHQQERACKAEEEIEELKQSRRWMPVEERLSVVGTSGEWKMTEQLNEALKIIREFERLQFINAEMKAQLDIATDLGEKRFQEIVRLRNALEIYADEKNWTFPEGATPDLWHGKLQGPEIARHALKECGK
jgi:hypothetical protein